MSMRSYLWAFITFFAFQSAEGESVNSSKEPLNIIFIMADDLGYETITANGGESYATPRIDRLAEMGVRFEHCYAQPICTPTRVKLMTGKYNVRNYEKFGLLPRNETTFAHLFKKAGYTTCIAGKWQLGKEPDSPHHFGFDQALLWQHRLPRTRAQGLDSRYENPILELNGEKIDFKNGEYGPELIANFICDFIDKNKSQPFLVYYPMLLAHCPFVPTLDSAKWNPQSMGSPTYKGDAGYFGDMVAYMDKVVGRIVDEVERQGLSDKTVIFFTGDNGTDKPIVSLLNGRKVAGGKGKTTDAGTRVPLIVYAPNQIKPAVVDDLVDFSDFLPTLCELADINLVGQDLTLDGRSFVPQLLGRQGDPREWVYCWYSPSGVVKKAKVFARTQRYKLYRDGTFYDLAKDALEESPLTQEDRSEEQEAIQLRLRNVIDHYSDLRTK